MASVDKIESFLSERHNVILAGIRRDGRPHLTPTFFLWDGERFYVSTTRGRAKYTIFRRDARAEMVVDDPAGSRAVLVSGVVEIREHVAAEMARFRSIKEKYGLAMPSEAEDLRSHIDEGRVLLAITPDGPPSTWVAWGLD
jgi:PPOX class probable F420-dependent enzyme